MTGRRVAGAVEIEIANPLPDAAAPKRSGHGVDSVRRRIAYHFGERGALETRSGDGVFHVIVRLPCAS
jgi:two-component system sensor histidine kinase AlgZ